MKNTIKRLITGLLALFSRELRQRDAPMRSFGSGIELLSQVVSPATVIDVGVASGTPDLYRYFPGVRYLLVEANPVFQPELVALETELNAVVETVFCGADSGTAELNLFSDPRKSSALSPYRNLRQLKQIAVPVAKLDDLLDKHNLPGPYLLKVDVEGAELGVLHGARESLKDTVAIVAEVSVLPGFEGGPEMAEIVAALAEHDFSVFDIVAGVIQPESKFLAKVDLIAVKRDAAFRVRERHSTISKG